MSDYRRVFVVVLGDAEPEPLVGDIAGGRLFRSDDISELTHHLLASAATPDAAPALCDSERQSLLQLGPTECS